MSTAAKATAPEPLPSEADFGCWDEAMTEFEEYREPEIANTAAAAAIASHVAAQTAELRAILERTQADLSRMTDKANRLVAERIWLAQEKGRTQEALRDALEAIRLLNAHSAIKNAAKRAKRNGAKKV